jgi:DNA-directed RNA polymerase specialized sigma24 family protein
MSHQAGSVSEWIGQLRAGDSSAVQKLWNRYFQQLLPLARKKLQGTWRQAYDEEDVALSALATFCRRALAGEFPQLSDRTDLWRLLIVLTARKALQAQRHEQRQKRGGSRSGSSANLGREWEEIVSREPTPEFAAQVAEECEQLLTRLGSRELRAIAVWKMEGYTTEEMAAQLRCARSTIERRLRLIRSLWKQEAAP